MKPAVQALLEAALAAQRAGRTEEARRGYERVLRADPRNLDALNLLGLLTAAAGDAERGMQLIRRAVAFAPGFWQGRTNLGWLLLQAGRYAEAVVSLDAALAIRPDEAVALHNRGIALLRLQRPADALASHDATLRTRPDLADAHADRGLTLRELRRPEEAIEAYGRALALQPENHVLRFAIAQCQLQLGDYAHGWPGLEHRATVPTGAARVGAPYWDGGDVRGRTVLLRAEQGFGDTIQFCRYAPLLQARGARVVLEVQPPLERLIRSLAGVDQVVARGTPLPPHDLQCLLMSLPLAFRTDAATIPAAGPYLAADPAAIEAWSTRLGPPSGRRVGVAWSGRPDFINDRTRSLTFARFATGLAPGSADFFAVQKDIRPADVPALAASAVRHFGPAMVDFAETAALMAHLDLIITTDTSVAHLAGALGRPTWLLLSWAPEWRWGLMGETSQWYPTMRLFRQGALGDWEGVLERVREEVGVRRPGSCGRRP